MLFRWRLAYRALSLGLDTTMVDTDVAMLRDPTMKLQASTLAGATTHHSTSPASDETAADAVVYCCNNVGLVHFPAASSQRSLPWLERFMRNLTTGAGEQDHFAKYAAHHMRVVHAGKEFKKARSLLAKTLATTLARRWGGIGARVCASGDARVRACCGSTTEYIRLSSLLFVCPNVLS